MNVLALNAGSGSLRYKLFARPDDGPPEELLKGGLEFLGVRLDDARNRAAGPDAPARISPDGAAVSVWLIPADEERQIARDVFDLLRPGRPG